MELPYRPFFPTSELEDFRPQDGGRLRTVTLTPPRLRVNAIEFTCRGDRPAEPVRIAGAGAVLASPAMGECVCGA